MLNKRIINTGGAGAACTTDTTQILNAGSTQSLALYRFEDNANDTAYTAGSIVSSNRVIDLNVNGYSSGTTITDSTSNYNNATIVGNVTYSNPSGSNGRFNLDGSSDYLQIGASTTFNSAANFTVEGWFKPDNITDLDHFFTIWDGGSNSKFYLRFTGTAGDIDGYTYTSGGGTSANVVTNNAAVRVQANVFNHIVMTYTDGGSGSIAVYINGALAGSATPSAAINTTGTADLYVGTLNGYHGSYDFDGEVGQIRFYNSALTATEVLQNFNATRALYAAYDGTNITAITYNSSGKFGKSAIFNGTSSYFKLPFSTLGNNPFTISMWLKFDDLTSERYIFSKYPGSGGYGMLCQSPANASTITFTAYNTSNSPHTVTTTTSMSTGTWYNYVITFDFTSSIKAYLNGSQEATVTTSGSFAQNSDTVNIGRYHAGATYFDGEMDQIRVFDKVLNAGEINSLYNETATSAALGTIDNPSTVAYYKMADASDETGSYNGTAYGVDFNVQGKYGFAGKFNGSAYIDINNSTSLVANKSAISISTWVYFDNINTQNFIFYNVESGGSNMNFGFYDYGNGNIYFQPDASSSANRGYISNSGLYSANEWVHIVMVFDGSATGNANRLKVYINNSLVTLSFDGTIPTTTGAADVNIRLGGRPSSKLNGKLDQIRVFNKAIDALEVTTLYNEIQCANTITAPEDYFQTKLYTGNGGTQDITGVGFAPGMTWIKARSVGYSHSLQDTLRGPGTSTSIYPDLTSTEGTYGAYGQISAFGTDGFTVASGGHGTYPTAQVNQSSVTYASWNWKAASSNTTNNDGTIPTTLRASQDSGFSMGTYTGNGTAGATIGHGLNSTPELVIVKLRSGISAKAWTVYAEPLGNTKYFYLNSNAGAGTYNFWNDTSPTSSVISLSTDSNVNSSSGNYVFYAFHSVDGYQRIGSYVGNGSANGPFIYTGFEPAFVMIKRTDTAGAWNIFDNKRNSANPRNSILQANVADQEYTNTNYNYNFYTNGFQSLNSNNDWNASGGSYIFIAIAANPDTTAPTKANSFNTLLYTGNDSNNRSITGLGFKPDFLWIKRRVSGSESHALYDSVRGPNLQLSSDTTGAEATNSGSYLGMSSFDSDGFNVGNNGGTNRAPHTYVAWAWKALDHDKNLSQINTEGTIQSIVSVNDAAGFSIVKYTGNSSYGQTVGHGLTQAPELVIIKNTDNARNWRTYAEPLGATKYINLDETSAAGTYGSFNNTAPTTTVFSTTNSVADRATNYSGDEYIAYCWHSVAGYSKIGTYTGNNPTKVTVTLGFRPSWIMIKSTSHNYGWWMLDNKRSPTGNWDDYLYANDAAAEGVTGGNWIKATDNGFETNATGGSVTNMNGVSYIYMAFK